MSDAPDAPETVQPAPLAVPQTRPAQDPITAGGARDLVALLAEMQNEARAKRLGKRGARRPRRRSE